MKKSHLISHELDKGEIPVASITHLRMALRMHKLNPVPIARFSSVPLDKGNVESGNEIGLELKLRPLRL